MPVVPLFGSDGSPAGVSGIRSFKLFREETHENVIRFAPPLIIDRETIDWATSLIKEVLCEEDRRMD